MQQQQPRPEPRSLPTPRPRRIPNPLLRRPASAALRFGRTPLHLSPATAAPSSISATLRPRHAAATPRRGRGPSSSLSAAFSRRPPWRWTSGGGLLAAVVNDALCPQVALRLPLYNRRRYLVPGTRYRVPYPRISCPVCPGRGPDQVFVKQRLVMKIRRSSYQLHETETETKIFLCFFLFETGVVCGKTKN